MLSVHFAHEDTWVLVFRDVFGPCLGRLAGVALRNKILDRLDIAEEACRDHLRFRLDDAILKCCVIGIDTSNAISWYLYSILSLDLFPIRLKAQKWIRFGVDLLILIL